jgi:DNA-binding NarL/FixJ family response regulator
MAVASSAVELLQLAVFHTPDIIIADVALPGMDGLAMLAQLAAIRKPPQFIFSWRYRDEPLLKPIMAFACASYIVRDAPPMEYGIAIRQAMRGTSYRCTQTKKLMDPPVASPEDAGLIKRFSKKYLLLIYCEILGYNCKETAIAAGLTRESVRTYRKRYKKLIGSRTFEALVRVLTMGN